MLQTKDLTKRYLKRGETILALDGVDLCFEPGELTVVQGPSGSGKTTLLLMLGGMLTPTKGTVMHDDRDLYSLSALKRSAYRKHHVGFLFQSFHLMPYLTVQDNIALPLALRGEKSEVAERVAGAAKRVGLSSRLSHRPKELSVGEQQRTAMARMLVGDPEIILADEPTGNLDKRNREIIADCLEEERAKGKTIVLATHDEELMKLGTALILIEDGKVTAKE